MYHDAETTGYLVPFVEQRIGTVIDAERKSESAVKPGTGPN